MTARKSGDITNRRRRLLFRHRAPPWLNSDDDNIIISNRVVTDAGFGLITRFNEIYDLEIKCHPMGHIFR